MEIRLLDDRGPRLITRAELPAAREDPAAIVWVDLPTCDDEARSLLLHDLGFHLLAVRAASTRQHTPKVHRYPDHVFLALHEPMIGESGHVHYIELDQFVGERLLVTVHGPTNPAVPDWVPLRETLAVWERIAEGRFRPRSAIDLSRAIVSAMAREMEGCLEEVTARIWALEQRVTSGELGDPEVFLDEMFRVRHALLAVANMTQGGMIIYGRLQRVALGIGKPDRKALADTADQFERVHGLADGQREYLQGVIDFYRTRLDTKMTIAAERLAVIAAVTLPATALASVLGMNLIASNDTDAELLWPILAAMVLMTLYVLWWARKHEWW